MKITTTKFYLQTVYFFNDERMLYYPLSDKELCEAANKKGVTGTYFANNLLHRMPRTPLLPIKKLFLTRKEDTIAIKKIAANQVIIALTGMLGKLQFVRKFSSSEALKYDMTGHYNAGGFYPEYFNEGRLIFNLFRANFYNGTKIGDHLFLTSRAEMASLYGEILSKYDWLSGGFFHEFIIRGIGYRYRYHKSHGVKSLLFKIGYGHRILFPLSNMKNITFRNNRRYDFVLSGMHKGKLKEFAEQIRFIKPSDPYKGKGIKYYHTPLKLKVGKVR